MLGGNSFSLSLPHPYVCVCMHVYSFPKLSLTPRLGDGSAGWSGSLEMR